MSTTTDLPVGTDLTMGGHTYPHRRTLRGRGWRYDSRDKCWRKKSTGKQAVALPGCWLQAGGRVIDGHDVWRARATTARSAQRQTYDIYDLDAAGNVCQTRRIPGSSPDELY